MPLDCCGLLKDHRFDGRIVLKVEKRMSDLQQAVIRTGGKQYRVHPGMVLKVEKLAQKVGSSIDFEVLLVGQGEQVRIGTPLVAGAKVSAEVKQHGRGKKLTVYKFKKRQNYRKKQGHRQEFTEIKITAIR